MPSLIEPRSDDFRDLLDLVVPEGGSLVALASIFVDESGTHEGSPVMTIGGVIFRKRQASEFSRKWSAYLRAKRVPYFHMADVTHPRNTIYDGWSNKQLIDFEKKLIRMVADHAEAGFAVSVSEVDYYSHFGDKIGGWYSADTLGEAYSYLLRFSVSESTHWAMSSNFDGRISYFFEAGHRHQSQANRILSVVLNPPSEELRKRYPEFASINRESRSRYFSHTFVDKKDAPPLQAADLLPWLWRNAIMKAMDGKQERLDLTALRRAIPIRSVHVGHHYMKKQRRYMEEVLMLAGLARE